MGTAVCRRRKRLLPVLQPQQAEHDAQFENRTPAATSPRGWPISCDVLVENFLPGTLDGWGLSYAALSQRNPRLVYCSITGFGQTGPRRDEPGYDIMIQALAGVMSITGEADGPPMKLGVAISDITAGMFA